MFEKNYKNGKAEGVVVFYTPSGKEEKKVRYKNDEIIKVIK